MSRENYEKAGVLIAQISRMKYNINYIENHENLYVSLNSLYDCTSLINLNDILSQHTIDDIISMAYHEAKEKLAQAEKEFNEL